MLKNTIHLAKKHKIITSFGILVIFGGGYYTYAKISEKKVDTQYVLTQVQKGTIISSVSGTGQVSVSNQVELKPKVSGDLISLNIKNGQEIKAGVVIAQINAKDALKSVRDAENNVQSARLSLEKLKKPVDSLSLLQSENSLAQAKDNLTKLKLSHEIDYQKAIDAKRKAEDDLSKAYEDGFNSVANAFLVLPGLVTGLDDIFLHSGDFEASFWNIDWYVNQVNINNKDKATIFKSDVTAALNNAKNAYTKNFEDYKSASRVSDPSTIEALINETYETTKLIATAVKTSNNYLDFIQADMEQYDRPIPTLMKTHQSNIDSYTGTTNTHLSSLLSNLNTLKTSRETIVNSERNLKEMDQNHPLEISTAEQTIREREASLAKLKSGTDALDIQSAELTLRQRQSALSDARENLGDYSVKAPFDGVIAKVDVKKGDSVSSGTSLATFITRQKIAEISLNEVDVAKIKTGQKATLTFDAVDGLSITGQVGEIDALGTVSQGVVSYTVKILFDTQDERVKSGMTVSAAIITDMKSDVLTLENSAVKSQGTSNYVEVLDSIIPASANQTGVTSPNAPRQQPVVTGIANDTTTEIVSGLKEGDQVILRTVTPSTNKTTTQAPSLIGGGGSGARTFGGNAGFRQ